MPLGDAQRRIWHSPAGSSRAAHSRSEVLSQPRSCSRTAIATETEHLFAGWHRRPAQAMTRCRWKPCSSLACAPLIWVVAKMRSRLQAPSTGASIPSSRSKSFEPQLWRLCMRSWRQAWRRRSNVGRPPSSISPLPNCFSWCPKACAPRDPPHSSVSLCSASRGRHASLQVREARRPEQRITARTAEIDTSVKSAC